MKTFARPMLAITALMAVLAGLGLFAMKNLDYALARYPGATRLGEGHFNLRAASQGYFDWNDTYQTADSVATVWRWYNRYLPVEPSLGMPAQGNCVALAANQRLVFQRTVRVSLCPGPHRTLVFVNQTVTFWP